MDSHIIVSLFHIFLVVPFFLYVAFQRNNNPVPVYYSLIVLAVILFLYHGYKAYVRLGAKSPYAWVNIIHMAIIAPLLFYIGLKKKETPRSSYEILAMVGFSALGYHMYSIVRTMMLEDD